MVSGTQTVFKYRTKKGPLHKLPALLKLILLLSFSVFCVPLPSHWLSAGIVIFFITALICGFSLREQLTDIKPAAFYALVMYALSVFSSLFSLRFSPDAIHSAILLPRPEFLRIALRLAVIVQISALLFRTTTSIEIRDSLNFTETAIRRFLSYMPFFGKRILSKPVFSRTISLFLCFIPQIFETWANIDLAWKARRGKQGILKIKNMVLILISLSFEKAAQKAKALEARSK
ncbi:MAG: energy-coupling factor transporter transmembrane protein EcfT [Treponema sp.]|jgi:biotin transport system permease protein/energy-coupling factor transport system permease protein|nr:energy-coupling factor transporter transmembrane protein EcfT [Treponema sp.]